MPAPDFMPILSHGKHASPKDGACVMELVSFLSGESWTDAPACTNPVLAEAARCVNDRLDDASRQRLLPLLPRLMGTGDTSDDQQLNVRLAVWSARRYLYLVRPQDRAVCETAIAAAEAWADNPCQGTAATYAASAASATAAASAAAAAARDAARDAARAALQPTVDVLKGSALALFDDMISPALVTA